ncbi:hypothetical protein [Methylobacterium nigriterrae]|uniref:hypothetical protein n=1 Tax=Methylobacterium nigriterrae TaxID=3127512 RepID=UPI0030139781
MLDLAGLRRRVPRGAGPLARLMGPGALLLGATLLLVSQPIRALRAMPGDSVIRFHEEAGVRPGEMRVFLHRPPGWRPEDGRLLVVLHGAERSGALMRDAWRRAADAYGALVIAPEFSAQQFPGPAWYNLGNVLDARGVIRPRDAWTFSVLDRAVEAVRAATGAAAPRYTLYGFSAGAQFVHRYVLLTGAPGIDRAVAASAGWYTLPDPGLDFPCGLRGTGVEAGTVRGRLAFPLSIQVGQRDTSPRDYFGSEGHEACADAQGSNRFARGRFFVEAGRRAAAQHDAPFAWRFVEALGVGHSEDGLADQAAGTLFALSTR